MSRKLDLSRKVWFYATYFQHKVIRQSSVQISLITQNFSAAFLEIIKRKNRREALSVSSENILHLTFSGLAKWLNPKLNRITEQPFCQTRVSGSTFVNADCFDVFPFIEDKSIELNEWIKPIAKEYSDSIKCKIYKHYR